MWCERVPDIILQRLAGVIIRLIFDVLEMVPAEYVTTARIQVDKMIDFLFVKGLGLNVNTKFDLLMLFTP